MLVEVELLEEVEVLVEPPVEPLEPLEDEVELPEVDELVLLVRSPDVLPPLVAPCEDELLEEDEEDVEVLTPPVEVETPPVEVDLLTPPVEVETPPVEVDT